MSAARYLLPAALLLASTPAFAIGKVSSPSVEKGELTAKYNARRTVDNNSGKDNAQAHVFSLEYSMTDRWQVEGKIGYAKAPQGDIEIDGYELEAKYEITQPGHWLASAVEFGYEQAAHSEDPNALAAKVLLEKVNGPYIHRTNIGLEQEVGHGASGGPDFSLRWSSRYSFSDQINPGFEIQSDFGNGRTLGHFGQQEHYIGPAIYGRLLEAVKYEAAAYAGISHEASDAAMRLTLEYETHF